MLAGWEDPTPQFSTFVPIDPVELCKLCLGDVVVMMPSQVLV